MRRRSFFGSAAAAAGLAASSSSSPDQGRDIPKRTFGKTGENLTIIGPPVGASR